MVSIVRVRDNSRLGVLFRPPRVRVRVRVRVKVRVRARVWSLSLCHVSLMFCPTAGKSEES